MSHRLPPTGLATPLPDSSRHRGRLVRTVLGLLLGLAGATAAVTADAQVMVVEPLRPVTAGYAPMAAGFPGGYIANYSPAGNYAAVTAFSPPMATPYVAGYPMTSYPVTQVANYAVEAAPAPVAVTAGYAPVAVTAYSPVVSAPVVSAPVAVTSYSPVVTPVVAAPVTTYYAPAVAMPLYRRGPFGGLRPVRSAMYIPY